MFFKPLSTANESILFIPLSLNINKKNSFTKCQLLRIKSSIFHYNSKVY